MKVRIIQEVDNCAILQHLISYNFLAYWFTTASTGQAGVAPATATGVWVMAKNCNILPANVCNNYNKLGAMTNNLNADKDQNFWVWNVWKTSWKIHCYNCKYLTIVSITIHMLDTKLEREGDKKEIWTFIKHFLFLWW